ncbi:MAG: primosomal protein N' [Spirochaetia bacterium]|nr:primosomal protein N' [Spirochaetia bacterium]
MYISVVVAKPLFTRFTYAFDPTLLHIEVGMRVVVPFGTKEITAFTVEVISEIEEASYAIKDVIKVVDKEPLFTHYHIKLAVWMSKFYFCSEGEALSAMIPSKKREKDLDESFGADYETLTISEDKLSNDQRNAVEGVLSSKESLHYLYGITGSGKTEVFFHIATNVIKQGKQVIYLVPEITLTYQLVTQLSTRFQNRVAILHSKMSGSQRLKEWKRIQRKEVDIIIGARSAIFAPIHNLGLIIIDEEHEQTYKAGNTPRYHARQVAQKIASVHNSKIVMGSATPSLEAWAMMKEGQVVRHNLTERVSGGNLPEVTVVDMLQEKEMISRLLSKRMKETLLNKRQVILFLNRRGFSYFFHCNSCGYEMSCPHCSVSLTYHKSEHTMVCHYCNYKTRPIRVCPTCSSLDVGYGGFGTQMVEEEIQKKFPHATICRIDADVSKKKGEVKDILDRFQKGEIDILLGTQMVAKGLNFPKVDLVGIVLADSALNLPDFRSQERTFSLILQVSGRSGRYNNEGKVIVQTYHAQNFAIQMATSNNPTDFYETELQVRKETQFPPYSRLVNMVVRGKVKAVCEKEINAIGALATAAIKHLPKDVVDLIGLSECPIEKINNNWRFHLMLRSKDVKSLLQVVSYIQHNHKVVRNTYLEIDVDPLHIL